MNRTNGDIDRVRRLLQGFNSDNDRPSSVGGVTFRRVPALPRVIEAVGQQIDDGRLALARVAGLPVGNGPSGTS